MPYIPPQHEKYNLLPACREDGGEVFDYPSELLCKAEKALGSCVLIVPYNYESYDDYYNALNQLILEQTDSSIISILSQLRERIMEMNRKEDWSILQYLGPSDDSRLGLTHGKNYYWPTQKSNPVYRGVIDDEEFTTYWYPTEKHLWKILEDPTGIAYNTIYGNGKNRLSQVAYDQMIAAFSSAVIHTQEE